MKAMIAYGALLLILSLACGGYFSQEGVRTDRRHVVSTPKKYTHLVRDPFFFFRGPFSYEALRYNKSSNLVFYDIIFGQRENVFFVSSGVPARALYALRRSRPHNGMRQRSA